ncbi:MAG TPA: hypothetical protein EYN67_00725 [Flavobacteriales bacterium]|nr:hypothetical protein [Flavobacteriales bacterium]
MRNPNEIFITGRCGEVCEDAYKCLVFGECLNPIKDDAEIDVSELRKPLLILKELRYDQALKPDIYYSTQLDRAIHYLEVFLAAVNEKNESLKTKEDGFPK